MNDEFLRRMRKTPPPAFLAGLKSRLDRQPLESIPVRRPLFVRGVIVGLLVSSAAFALASLSLGGFQASLRELGAAPGRLWARIGTPATSVAHDAAADPNRHATYQLPWNPRRVEPTPVSPADVGRAVANGRALAEVSSQGLAASGSPVISPTESSPGSPDTLNIVAAPETYSYTTAIAASFARLPYCPKCRAGAHVTTSLSSAAIDGLCGGVTENYPDAVITSRRITAAELQTCAHNGVDAVNEAKVGYTTAILARSRLYGPLKVSARDVFLALARRIPDPAHAEALIDNPYVTWNQVNPSLPYDRIEIIGPGRTSVQADTKTSVQSDTMADLLLEAGCNSYPWLAALRTGDPEAYDAACKSIRSDSVYVDSNASSLTAFADQLAANPNAVGIFDGKQLQRQQVAVEMYRVSRTFYLYVNASKTHGSPVKPVGFFVNTYLQSLPTEDWRIWGFVPPDFSVRGTTQINANELQALKP